jgi:hypothetical protein
MHDDRPDPDDELAESISAQQLADDETELSEHDIKAHTLSIRRADGSEVVTVVSAVGQGSNGRCTCSREAACRTLTSADRTTRAFGSNTDESSVSRDEDGTYINYID